MVTHTGGVSAPRPLPRTLLLGVAADPQQAARARDEGADLIDVQAATPGALAAIRVSLPAAVLWTDPPADPVDADQLAGDSPAAIIAVAAICTWLGVPVIRSRHTRAVRRAIDMTAAIAGQRPPSHTVRGLA